MEKIEWTDEQLDAIDTRDKTLLISAAAGSGKTATLTERIIRSILDADNPISIKDMLIVTFTNAAVDQLRDKISEAIRRAAAESPDSSKLEEELLTVKDAKIMTIDAFCNSILRISADSVGLPPNYRIGDEAELSILKSAVMEGLIEACYEGELPEICSAKEFARLAECLTTARGEGGLAEVFISLYEETESAKEGLDTLRPLIDMYRPENFVSVDSTRFGEEIKKRVDAAMSSYKSSYGMLRYMENGNLKDMKAYPKLLTELSEIEAILAADSYAERRELIQGFTQASMRGLRGDSSEYYTRIMAVRKMLKADIDSFREKFYSYTENEWRELYEELYAKLSILFRFLKKFDSLFRREKLTRGVCSYGDIERYAYSAMWQGGERTDLAKELAASFSAVYIDEYQDVNSLQNAIFEAVSSPTNRFMVGDIKQSIYGFRSAKPEIFAEMKRRFPKFSRELDSDEAGIFMSRNFRCDREIIDFTNGIFDKMFGVLGKSIEYDTDDRLIFSKKYKEGEHPRGNIPEIHVMEKLTDSGDYSGSDEDIIDEATEAEAEAIEIAAAAVARKVDELIHGGIKADGKLYKPKDIAIILRSAKGRADKYRDALAELGIRASIADNGEFFLNEEILLALALLNSIDNPRRDIYLAALMMSPLFGFTPDEMLAIKRGSKAETLYEALLEYRGRHPDYKRGADFIEKLNSYRELSEGISVDALLARLYRETGLLSLAERNGGKENLILLHNYARRYEESSYKGLYSFISYVNSIIDQKKKFDTGAATVEDTDTVRIITAHKSKGLEYPACFFVESHTRIRKNPTERIAYEEDFGISMLLKDPSGTALVANPVQNVINAYKSDKEYEEELRILYVILTRARESLFVYGTAGSKDYASKLQSLRMMGEELDSYKAKKFSSMLDIIVATRSIGRLTLDTAEGESTSLSDIPASDAACAEGEEITEEENIPELGTDPSDAASGEENDSKDGSPPTDGEGEGGTADNEDILSAAELLKERFTFKYPHTHLELLPEKLSVSRLSPGVLDGTDKNDISLEELLDYVAEARSAEASSPAVSPDGGAGTEWAAGAPDICGTGAEGAAEDSDFKPYLPEFVTKRPVDESAKRGIATHTFLQFCDFEGLRNLGAEAELDRLVAQEFISEKDKERVRIKEINRFVRSKLFAEMMGAKKLYRELRFNIKLPADIFTRNEELKAALKGEEILVQGVIDCVIEAPDGSLHLVDYKTDRLKPSELSDRAQAEGTLKKNHSLQLLYYKQAVKAMFGREPDCVGIYSLHLGDEVVVFN